MRPSLRHLSIACLAVLALGVAACGSDKSGDSASTGTQTAAQDMQTTGGASTAAASAPGKAPTVSANLKEKPTIPKPEGTPPAKLQKIDVVKGTGPVAGTGDNVTVQYVGANWSNGQEFDASWDRGQPFTFPLGAGQVIPGWDQGVKGMRVGGRRELVVPPDLGYGAQGTPDGSIPANETLVFVVDLEKVGSGG